MVCPPLGIKYHMWQFKGNFINSHVKKAESSETFSFYLFNASFGFLFPLANFAVWQLRQLCLNNTLVWFHRRYGGKKHLKTTLTSESIKALQKKGLGIIHHSTLLLSFSPLLSALQIGQQHLFICLYHPIMNPLVDSIWSENETYRLAP